MSSSYPGGLDSFATSHVDDVGEIIRASTINELADAVNKIQAALGTNPFKGGIVYNVKAYGAVGDGVANDTAAIQSAVAAINAAGKGTLVFPSGTYKVTSVVSSTLFQFTNLAGVNIQGEGAVISDTQVFTGTQIAYLFKFTNCQNIDLSGVKFVEQTASIPTEVRGLRVFVFEQGCVNVNFDVSATGGNQAVAFIRLDTDPESYRCKLVSGKVSATNVYYAYSGQFSGDNAIVQVDATGCGRNFIVYGVRNVKLLVNSKNQKVSSIIDAYSGFGCEDLTVDYRDRDSDSNTAGAAALQLGYGDITPATHRNIRIRLDVKNPASSPFGNTLELYKESSAGVLDNVARGHVLDGLEVSGVSEQTGTRFHFDTTATFATTDKIRNVSFRDLTLLGANAWQFVPGTALVGRVLHQNIYSDHYVYCVNGSTGRAVYLSCDCGGFTSATTNTDLHTYISCRVSDGTLQSVRSKKFFDTAFASDELSYVEFAANVSPVVTTEGTAVAVVTAAAIVFDGSTKVKIAFFTPRAQKGTTNLVFVLHDGAASIGLLGSHFSDGPVRLEREFIPPAGSKTYSIRAYVDAGTGLVAAGNGGLGLLMPGFIRVTKVG